MTEAKQQPQGQPGPPSPWSSMTPQELEAQYSPSRWSCRLPADTIIKEHVRVTTASSAAVRQAVPHRLHVPYGAPGPRALLDVYGENLPSTAPVMVYVHGGYWQELSKDVSGYVVGPLYRAGVLTVVLGYDLAPTVGVQDIVAEVRAGVRWACELARGRGSKGVVLAGWSAGGQLVAQVLSEPPAALQDPEKTPEDLTCFSDLICGLVTFSAVFDLRPLVTTYVNDPLHLTHEEAWVLSPLRVVDRLAQRWPSLKVLTAVGQHDSPEFRRQTSEYSQACGRAGLQAEQVEVEAMDHFSLVEELARDDFSLSGRLKTFLTCPSHMPSKQPSYTPSKQPSNTPLKQPSSTP